MEQGRCGEEAGECGSLSSIAHPLLAGSSEPRLSLHGVDSQVSEQVNRCLLH